MSTSDKILLYSTISLIVVALIVPYFAELLKRYLFRPVLKINFKLAPPSCHRTTFNLDPEKPAYFFRFEVSNIGKSICLNVENQLENVWIYNKTGQPIKIEDFTPINLKWSLQAEILKQHINPRRRVYCNIGHIPNVKAQMNEQARGILINPIGYSGNDLRFELDLVTFLNAQLNCLTPGTYILQINTYAENHNTLANFFKISWSGQWKNDLESMFKELVITPAREPVKPK